MGLVIEVTCIMHAALSLLGVGFWHPNRVQKWFPFMHDFGLKFHYLLCSFLTKLWLLFSGCQTSGEGDCWMRCSRILSDLRMGVRVLPKCSLI